MIVVILSQVIFCCCYYFLIIFMSYFLTLFIVTKYAIACADAEALLHVLSSSEKEPDVIVSDIRMPNSSMDGLKLLSLLKGNDPEMYEFSKWKNIPVILLTAKSLTPDRIAGYKLGAQAYLSKPFSPDELLSIIDNLIRRRTEQSNALLDTKTLDILKDDLNDIKSLLRTTLGSQNIGCRIRERQSSFSELSKPAINPH